MLNYNLLLLDEINTHYQLRQTPSCQKCKKIKINFKNVIPRGCHWLKKYRLYQNPKVQHSDSLFIYFSSDSLNGMVLTDFQSIYKNLNVSWCTQDLNINHNYQNIVLLIRSTFYIQKYIHIWQVHWVFMHSLFKCEITFHTFSWITTLCRLS